MPGRGSGRCAGRGRGPAPDSEPSSGPALSLLSFSVYTYSRSTASAAVMSMVICGRVYFILMHETVYLELSGTRHFFENSADRPRICAHHNQIRTNPGTIG